MLRSALERITPKFAPHFSTMTPSKHYDYIVIGGGSAGVASARRAASYGAKTLVIEGCRLGGTCVNVGCVPKKVMWNASHIATTVIHHAKEYEIEVPSKLKFDWKAFKGRRDAYVKRLNGIYESNLRKEGAEYIYGWADFVDKHTIEVKTRSGETERYTGEHIAIAVGGEPTRVNTPEGADRIGITSDGFFELETQPKSVALIGSGYIAVELAGVFNALGSETHLLVRQDGVLRSFDTDIGATISEIYEKHGVNIHRHANVSSIARLSSGRIKLKFSCENKSAKTVEVDEVVWAIGRQPITYKLSLERIGIKTDKRGKIVVDEYQNTSVSNIYSLGDVAEHIELTPAAIAAGRKLGDRLFGGQADAKVDYSNIPSAIFSHPEAGSIGLSEAAAKEKFGKDKVKVYSSRFINMYYSPMAQEHKDPSLYKVVCAGPAEKVVGIHIVGDAAGEILQGFGVAVKMGATKKDLDSCVAIHPTAAEELVTLK